MNRRLGWLFIPAALASCSPVLDDEEFEHEPEDFAESTEPVISCNARSAQGFQAGTPRTITVVDVDGKPVELNTANAFSRMRDAAARAGVQIRVNSGFRTNEEQTRLYACFTNCNCNDCNLAARPGYSNHQSGLALDLNTSRSGVLSWLNRNASRYGFRRTVSSEAWHWEYNGAQSDGPCSRASVNPTPSAPANPTGAFTVVAPADGGHYTNGVWFKVRTNGTVHHVRYDSSGYVFGASEDAGADFAYRRVFNNLGEHQITVRGFDADDREIAKKTFKITVTDGDEPGPELEFVDLEDGAAYRNGFALSIKPVAGVAKVGYSSGAYGLGVSTDAENGFPVEHVFTEYGARTIIATAMAADGTVVSQRAITVKIMPGSENGVPPAIRFLNPMSGERFGQQVIQMMAIGSDSVSRVVYYADGVEIGTSRDADGGFPFSRQFWQVGSRKLRVIGFNAQGAVAAEHEITVNVR